MEFERQHAPPHCDQAAAEDAAASPAFSAGQAISCFLLAAALAVAMGLRGLPGVLAGGLINPDSTMRLLRLQEWLAQGKLVHVIPRDGSGLGTVLHWSHFLDAILLAAAAPLAILFGWDAALRAVLAAAGPVSAGLLGAALAWAIAPASRADLRWLAAVAAAAAVPVAAYAAPGVVPHHIPVAVAVVLTLGWAARGPVGGTAAGWRMGLAAAAGILLTPESMPFTLMGFGLLGLARLGGSQQAGQAAEAAGVTFFIVIALALAIDPPLAGYGAAEIDRLSTVYLGLAAACAVGGCGLSSLGRVTGAVLAVAALTVWLLAFPSVIRGPAGLLPPKLAVPFFKDIAEMGPITRLGDAVVFLTPGLLGLVALAWIGWRRRSLAWGYATLCGAVVLGLAIGHVRFSTYAAILGAAMLPVALGAITAALTGGARAAARLALLGGVLLLPPAGALLEPAQAGTAAACSVQASAPALAPLAGQVLMADPNETPDLLRFSGVLTVGSLYHRNAAAFVRLRDAWRAAAGDAVPDAVLATRATHILVCPGTARSSLVRDLPAATLLDALAAGRPPGWATAMGTLPGGHLLYRISP